MRPEDCSAVHLGEGYGRVQSLHLDWEVDFTAKRLRGAVELQVTAETAGPMVLMLDTKDLTIHGVQVDGVDCTTYRLYEEDKTNSLGTPLRIELPRPASKAGEVFVVRVAYETSPDASALQWLAPPQTTSGRYPYLFSQSQAIHARSVFPCQDLCLVKVPYTATVTHPTDLTALMSAIRSGSSPSTTKEGFTVTTFRQDVPIPSYLVAIAVGEIASRSLGPRSTVWAEPDVVERAAWEFAETEHMIDEAEALCGPYRWGVFDLLVLPPSFPYGGMENPCLTFVTPTLLAGDRSQVAVIAHELAHSWSGNLVTNTTWKDFWINEGVTVFTETKIVERLYGKDSAAIRKAEGWQHVQADVDRFGSDHNFTCLCPRLGKTEDPDDSFSSVPYEKGCSLLACIEAAVGKAAMEDAMRKYFDTFAFRNVSSEEFRSYFIAEFPKQLEGVVDWEAWFHQPGMPLFKPTYDDAPVQAALSLSAAWSAAGDINTSELVASTAADFAAWPSGKKCIFLNGLKISSFDRLAQLAQGYRLLQCNTEIRCALLGLWLPLWKQGLDDAPIVAARTLVQQQGRMKFTRPTYRAWYASDPQGAQAAFLEYRASYHPICSKMVAKDLQIAS